jgi:hypothetical protein
MTRTPIRFTLVALATASLIAVFASPAWAPEPVCPTCSYRTTWGITDSETLRVCLVGLATRPPRAVISWRISFSMPDGELVQAAKEARVPQEGFRCVDTTPQELRSAGFATDSSGRIQFGLQIMAEDSVPLLPRDRQPEITMGGTGWHSVETINIYSGETTNSHRFGSSRGFGFVEMSTPAD